MEEIKPKELTVAQVDELMQQPDMDTLHVIDMLYPDRIPFSAVCMSCGKTAAEMEKLDMGEYFKIMELAEDVNPTYFAALQGLANRGRELMAAAGEKASPTRAPS